ncbi:MAG: tail fiber protein [Bacteroidia bacterium]
MIAEIRLFAGNFAPKYWAFCDGALLPIASYQPLFSLLGTTYGGDGINTFALPDLRGRVPVHVGNSVGPGLPPVGLGQKFGTETTILRVDQMPPHSHPVTAKLRATDAAADTRDPSNAALAKDRGTSTYQTTAPANVDMKVDSVSGGLIQGGNGQAIENHQPSLGLNYIIALVGVYPSRS